MTLQELRALVHEEFPTHQSFVRWSRPITWDGLTIVNDTSQLAPSYIRTIKVSWKGDFVSYVEFDHDLCKWSEGRRRLAFRLWKEIEKFND